MFRLFEKLNKGEVYIIAEMSANHGGKLDNALEIVHQVAETGADCLKIQTYTADSITIDSETPDFRIKGGLWDGYKLYDLYMNAGTPYEWQACIKEECERSGIDFLSTPFDPKAVDFLESIGCEAYKIASFELVDIPLIEYAASKGRPMIMSCGMASEEEIRDAIDACRRMGNNLIVLLKCCSEYPANWDNMHLANIPDMKVKFQVPIGLSDHSEGNIASIVAIGLGACVVEKHVKIDGIESADSKFSMSIPDFKKLVEDVRAAKSIIGQSYYGPTPGEIGNYGLRRSLFAVLDISEGDVITNENIRSIRPGTGVLPKHLNVLLGKKAKINIKKGTPITEELLEKLV